MKRKKYIYVFTVGKERVFVQANTLGEAEDALHHWISNKYGVKKPKVLFSYRKDNPGLNRQKRFEIEKPVRKQKLISNETSNNPNQ